MDIADVFAAVEGEEPGRDPEEVLSGLSEHKDTLHHLGGAWAAMLDALDDEGAI